MNQSMKQALLFAAVVTLASGAAFADDTFKQADADQSGTISKQEASALPGLSEKWDTYDLNTDGELDAVEFARFELAMPKDKESGK